MNHMNEAAEESSGKQFATRVPEAKRPDCLARHFGCHQVRVEQGVFGWMERLAPAYRGGYWEFNELPNGGFYMAPHDGPYTLSWEGNGFEGTVSADAAGVIACLMCYSHLSFVINDPRISNSFRHLLACVHRHPEGAAILRAID